MEEEWEQLNINIDKDYHDFDINDYIEVEMKINCQISDVIQRLREELGIVQSLIAETFRMSQQVKIEIEESVNKVTEISKLYDLDFQYSPEFELTRPLIKNLDLQDIEINNRISELRDQERYIFELIKDATKNFELLNEKGKVYIEKLLHTNHLHL